MRTWIGVLVLVFVFSPALAWPEIYSWVDDQGVQNYTTRLESIPEPYRSQMKSLSLPGSPTPPPQYQATSPRRGMLKVPFAPGSPIVVSAMINGTGPLTLILDTGAERTLITSSGVQKLGLLFENAGQAVVQGVTGVSLGNAVWVNSVEVGEVKVGPLLVIVHDTDLKEADGLLGRDFLSNFHVMIDSKEGTVTLTPN